MNHRKKGFRILIVDSDEEDIKLLRSFCEDHGYETIVARNSHEAVEQTLQHLPDLILMDEMMPEMKGIEIAERLKSHELTGHIPIVILSTPDSSLERSAGIARGVDDFLLKPVDSVEFTLRVKNLLKLKECRDFLRQHKRILEDQVAEKIKAFEGAFERLEKVYRRIRTGYAETVFRLTLASEYKDEDSGAHIKRISLYTKVLASALGMSKEYIETIYYASPMHDIGKVGIPERVLLKKGGLTPEEWEIVKTHTTIGAQILRNSNSPYLRMAEEIALTHHERWDGSGYPKGLKGEKIPVSGRIMNIVDQYDALRSRRPYKPVMDHESVVNILTAGDVKSMPKHFDPQVFEAFMRSSEMFREIYEARRDDLG
ncbi:MAG: response regulator [Nitrospirae bacterium]|nr:response regulator [Nitrospirota bacterium]